jgi:uncharacterized protein (DUF362 family)
VFRVVVTVLAHQIRGVRSPVEKSPADVRRRYLLRGLAVLGLLGSGLVAARAQTSDPVASPLPVAEVTPLPARSVVYRTKSSDAIYDYKVNGAEVRRMVDDVVISATGQPNVAAAWASLVKPNDVVGIKVCANGAPLFSTHPEVVQPIIDGLRQAGVPPENIIVWDRDAALLKRAGFRFRKGSYRVMWNEDNYDPKVALTSPVTGRLIYGDLLFVGKPRLRLKTELEPDEKEKKFSRVNMSNESHLSLILSKVVTKVVNVPVLSDNVYCGLSGALFNMTVQNVDNWRRLIDERVRGDPDIAEMYADPRISEKVVLHIMDGLVALYAGAPFGDTNYAVQFGAIYASKDPVALDTVAAKQLDGWRIQAKMDPASKIAKYIQTASQYQLGNSDLAKIEIRDSRNP